MDPLGTVRQAAAPQGAGVARVLARVARDPTLSEHFGLDQTP